MRTSTEFMSESSAPTISTSFDFHLFDFLIKGDRCVSYVYVFIVSLSCHNAPRPRCVLMHEVDTYKDRF